MGYPMVYCETGLASVTVFLGIHGNLLSILVEQTISKMLNKIILLLLVTIRSVANMRPGGNNRPGQNQRTDIAQMIRNLGSQLCPHTDFCYTNASEAIYDETKDPCCRNCSCNDDCWETQRCCPDKADRVIREQPTYLECKETVTKDKKNDQNLDYDGYNFDIRMYFITDKCPDENTEEQLREKCSGGNKTGIDDYRWVSDEQTGKIYQNRHCALCHGLKTWWSWNILTTCDEIFQAHYTNITEIIFSEYCDLINEVPETHAELVARFRCYSPSITSCNRTGLWRRYDRHTEDACQSFTQIYFPYELRRTVYKNVFCYLCNAKERFPTIHLCRKPDQIIKGPTSFSALINVEEIKAEPPDNVDCRVDELYDVYLV